MEDQVNVGHNIICEGPVGKCRYNGQGNFILNKKALPVKRNFGLLAAGTGITPGYCMALASSLLKDGLNITLLFTNKTKEDILCESELNDMKKLNPDHYALYHTLTRHEDDKHGEWTGHRGRVSLKMIQECGFPKPAEDTFIFICGPKGFKKTIYKFLEEGGYEKSMYNT